eukprot:GHVT01039442.1.p1 GENE.GHVT01039442.1~~GHVT01039442.1.p1  ORF type:complete len:103 (-),score=6.00 GHVT01039442.1:3123-3431(-)
MAKLQQCAGVSSVRMAELRHGYYGSQRRGALVREEATPANSIREVFDHQQHEAHSKASGLGQNANHAPQNYPCAGIASDKLNRKSMTARYAGQAGKYSTYDE